MTAATPFWRSLPAMALFPLRGDTGILLFGLGALAALGGLPFLGGPIALLIWLTACKQAFEILRATADGNDQVPDLVASIGDGVLWRFVALQVMFLAATALALVLGGTGAALLVLALTAFLQPGCIMSLAIDGRLDLALNPATSIGLLARIGPPYLAVFALLLLVQAVSMFAGAWLAAQMPLSIGRMVQAWFAFWGLFVAFRLMGALVYRYHEALGYQPERHRDALPPRPGPADDPALMARIDSLLREGEPKQALEALRSEARERAMGLEAHALYHRLLRESGDIGATLEHAAQYLQLLLRERQEPRVLALLRESLALDPGFLPADAAGSEQLHALALRSGQSQLALDILQALLRRHPRHPAAPRWALEAAMLLHDRFGRDADARELIETARAQCVDADLRERLEAASQALVATG